MYNPFIILGIIMVYSFWHIDRSIAILKKEQDKRLDQIEDGLNTFYSDFEEKIN